MRLLRVSERDSRLFADSMAIIRGSISEDTQLPQPRLERLLAGGGYQLFAYADGEQAEGAALVYFAEGLRFVWLDYLAIRFDLRGRGLGSALFREIAALAAKRSPPPDWVLLEVDDDREGDEQHQVTCARRINFYQRLEAKLLENVPYRFPCAFAAPIPMRLMVRPLRQDATLTSDDLRSVVREIFGEIHDRGADDDLLRWFEENLPEKVATK